jgi:HSP20 family molecular chaperone IbpA
MDKKAKQIPCYGSVDIIQHRDGMGSGCFEMFIDLPGTKASDISIKVPNQKASDISLKVPKRCVMRIKAFRPYLGKSSDRNYSATPSSFTSSTLYTPNTDDTDMTTSFTPTTTTDDSDLTESISTTIDTYSSDSHDTSTSTSSTMMSVASDFSWSGHHFERFYGQCIRTFELPTSCNIDRIEAELDNGVLKITIPCN